MGRYAIAMTGRRWLHEAGAKLLLLLLVGLAGDARAEEPCGDPSLADDVVVASNRRNITIGQRPDDNPRCFVGTYTRFYTCRRPGGDGRETSSPFGFVVAYRSGDTDMLAVRVGGRSLLAPYYCAMHVTARSKPFDAQKRRWQDAPLEAVAATPGLPAGISIPQIAPGSAGYGADTSPDDLSLRINRDTGEIYPRVRGLAAPYVLRDGRPVSADSPSDAVEEPKTGR